MKHILIGLCLCLTLGACRTTRTYTERTLSAGNGAAVINLCLDRRVRDNGFTTSLSQFDPETRALIEPTEDLKKYASRNVNLFDRFLLKEHPENNDWVCSFWAPELAPGHYAITSLKKRLLHGPGRVGVSPLVNLFSAIGTAAISLATENQVDFTTEEGRVKLGAPEFTITPGDTVYLGTIAFEANVRMREAPVRDKTGYWDGQTTEPVIDLRLFSSYTPPGDELTELSKRIAIALRPRRSASLTALEDREFLLQEFPEIKPEDRY